ncbi:adenylate/guanylate cyclase domain-containing protein [Natronospirillum operosum]|uniref:Adenylate/guanylate cyclase domain-containing protein n=1 Tax=Natronospirillum operosum TaxID=2759953 RepID=A0A4Z0WCQ6_9GAMM|nr:adenylate/guanylate cyclase domain-containing protein [Natronospirillum operosum]TGG91652.1 adenylate/guanylate cyclase domain-containing protein [Natronospirillum operosum]
MARLIRYLGSLLILVLLLGHSLGSWSLAPLTTLERLLQDLQLQSRQAESVDPRVVIVDIDEPSLGELGQWPWPRTVLADLVDQLFDHYDIRALGLDMVFPEPEQQAVWQQLNRLAEEGELPDTLLPLLARALDGDQRLAEALRGRPVVGGFLFQQHNPAQLNALPAPLPVEPDRLRLPTPVGYSANVPVLHEAMPVQGFFDNPALDSDGVYRSATLLQQAGDGVHAALAVRLLQLGLGDLPLALGVSERGEEQLVTRLQIGSLLVPLGDSGQARVPYQGPRGQVPYVSAADILAGRADPGVLQNRMVLLGTSAPGLLDIRTTPVDALMPGVEVHAQLMIGILDQRVPRLPDWALGAEILLMLALAGLLVWIHSRLQPLPAVLLIMGAGAGLLAAHSVLWRQGLILPVAALLALLVALYVYFTTWSLLVENRSRRQLTRTFGRYVPQELVAELARQPSLATTRGEQRDMTVLFSDVCGFTPIAEQLDAETLTRLMNRLLTPVTADIHRHRGTIDKYMGDAVMAFWGAPLPDADHANRAVAAALAMCRSVQWLSAELAHEGLPELRLGIGISTGRMSVGNMGSDFRMAYTVMGDPVNLGARLEALTRQYDVDILVSEDTARAATDFEFRAVDETRVKGKAAPVRVYTPVVPKDPQA